MAAASSPNPYVELLYSDLHPNAIRQTEGRYLGTPAQQIEAALSTHRLLMINYVKAEIRKSSTATGAELLRLADLASSLYLGRFVTVVGPSATTAYINAFKRADAGDVPMDLVFALANQHAERMGRYFNETSKEAMLMGFTRMVNKGVPERVAAERAMDAFGLTPRQMTGYVALEANLKTHSSVPRNLKAKALGYIGNSIRRRLKVFSTQEEHNLSQQGQQVVWMWLRDKGKLSSMAEKVWITARDEKVCKICGPMHGKRVGLADRFELPGGADLYVPGAHVNCRCEVKLVDPVSIIGKAEFFEEHEHPRSRDGRFRTKTKEKEDLKGFQAFLDDAATKLEPEQKIELKPVSAERINLGAVNLRPAAINLNPINLNLSSASTMNLTPTAQRISLMPAKQKIELKLATARVVMQQLAKEPTKQPKRKVFYRETFKLDKPVYAVIAPEQLDHDGRVMLSGDEVFTPDQSKAALEAASRYHENIESTVHDLMADGRDYLEEYDEGGNSVYAVIDTDTMYDIVAAIASGEIANLNRNQVNLEWMDHAGHPIGMPDRRSWGSIAAEWGLVPDDFRVYVMRVDEGHNGHRGETTALGANKDKYSLTGTFNTVYGSRDQVGHSADVTILHGEPDVPMEEFGDNPDD